MSKSKSDHSIEKIRGVDLLQKKQKKTLSQQRKKGKGLSDHLLNDKDKDTDYRQTVMFSEDDDNDEKNDEEIILPHELSKDDSILFKPRGGKGKKGNIVKTVKKVNAKFDWLFIKRFIKIMIKKLHFCTSFKQLLFLLIIIIFTFTRCFLRDKVYDVISKFYTYFIFEEYNDLALNLLWLTLLFLGDSIICEGVFNFAQYFFYYIWRKELTIELLDKYFEGQTYYEILQLRESNLDNPDQRIQSDVNDFCKNLSIVTVKSIVQVISIVFNTILMIYRGFSWMLLPVYLWPILNTIIYAILFSPVSKQVFEKNRAEGDFRFGHMRIREHAESIAFYRSSNIERSNVESLFKKLLRTLFRLSSRFMFLNLYFAVSSQLPAVSYLATLGILIYKYVPPFTEEAVLSPEFVTESVGKYYQLANGTGQLISEFFKLSNYLSVVIGNTARIAEMFEMFEIIKKNQGEKDRFSYKYDDRIRFFNVQVKTPGDKILMDKLNFEVRKGENLLVCGPSGTGKTSILRMLSGLWDFEEGRIFRPKKVGKDGMFFLSQKPYLVKGTLKQNIIYPHDELNVSDKELEEVMKLARIDYLLQRASLHDEDVSWDEMLSGGEQQRIQIARVFLVKPKFAVLDESTSALDPINQDKVYENLRDHGITCITISNRKSLVKFHHRMLKLEVDPNDQTRSLFSIKRIYAPPKESQPFTWTTIVKRVASDKEKGEFELSSKDDVEKYDTDIGKSGPLSAIRRLYNWLKNGVMIKKNVCSWVTVIFIACLGIIPGVVFIPLSALQSPLIGALSVRNFRSCVGYLVAFTIVLFVGSCFYALIKWIFAIKGIWFRKNITMYAHDKYFNNEMFYKTNILDKTIDNNDQRICQDIDQVTSGFETSPGVTFIEFEAIRAFVSLISHGVYAIIMIGVLSPLYAFSIFLIAAFFELILMKYIGKYRFLQQKKEGYFRFTLTRMKEYSEQIAFHNGKEKEKRIIMKRFRNTLKNQISLSIFQSINDVFLLLLTNSTYLFAFLLLFILTSTRYIQLPGVEDYEITITIISLNSSLFVDFMTDLMDLLATGEYISNVVGYIGRVGQMLEHFENVEKGTIRNKSREKKRYLNSIKNIKIENLTLETPDFKKLFYKLHLEINKGESYLIKGPSGCGKSSLLRVIARLWRIRFGKVSSPFKVGENGLFFLPQTPYLIYGSLKQQLIYPDEKSKKSEKDLFKILEDVKLDYLLERVGGWNEYKVFSTILSPGEQQRIGIARLIYHKPLFACLDESTSALDQDNEDLMYRTCVKHDISVISVGHRLSLDKFHDYSVVFDGKGSWELFKKQMESISEI